MTHPEAVSPELLDVGLRCPAHPNSGMLVPFQPREPAVMADGLAGEPGLRCSECGRIFPVSDGILALVVGQEICAESHTSQRRLNE
jgi:hypothetical protein